MCDLKQFVINLPALAEGHHEVELKANEELFADRGNLDVLGADIDVFVDIFVGNGNYNVGITCRGWIDIPCDRCLDALRFDLDEDYDITLRYGDEFNETDDSITLPGDVVDFDLAPLVADTVLLSIPLRHVHPEGECNPRMEQFMKEHYADDPGRDEDDI